MTASALREPLAAQFEHLPADWRALVEPWRQSDAGQALLHFVDSRVASGATVYPRQVLHALLLTPLASVRVVILGQDPYHGPGQAHGLAFSVPTGVKMPPSLRNIATELVRDLGSAPLAGDLSAWARQGVLLLNTSLTVEDGAPASHARKGWELLTESVVQAVARRGVACVYMLWGAHAQRLEPVILQSGPVDGVPPLVLKANHPSPLSARRPPEPFIGCGHFSRANEYLGRHGPTIDWSA